MASGFSDYNVAMHAESLVDGMDLDDAWCKKHLELNRQEEFDFAMHLVRSKRGRLDYMFPDGITCYVKSASEAERIRRVPGRDE